jgi:hypothetical protein
VAPDTFHERVARDFQLQTQFPRAYQRRLTSHALLAQSKLDLFNDAPSMTPSTTEHRS